MEWAKESEKWRGALGDRGPAPWQLKECGDPGTSLSALSVALTWPEDCPKGKLIRFFTMSFLCCIFLGVFQTGSLPQLCQLKSEIINMASLTLLFFTEKRKLAPKPSPP